MAWSPGTKIAVLLYTAIIFFGVEAVDICCKRAVLSYATGTAIPPECGKSKCFEASIHIEKPGTESAPLLGFFPLTTKTSTLTIIGNKDAGSIMFASLVEVVHKGPGPAIYLDDADLHDSSFSSFQKITVDEIEPYCLKSDLVVVKGSSKAIWRERLESVANKTLLKCSTLTSTVAATTTALTTTTTKKATTTVGNRNDNNAKAGAAVDEDKICPTNYILIVVAVVALLIMIVGLVIVYIWASRLAALRKEQEKRVQVAETSLASISSYATQLICTIIAMEVEQDQKIIELIPRFIRQSKVKSLSNQLKVWHQMSISQLAKFKTKRTCQSREFVEALEKLEIVKKAHVAGKEFTAPKDTKAVSDFRRKNPTEDMTVIAKKCRTIEKFPVLLKKMKINAEKPWEGYKKAAEAAKESEEKPRKKAGEDTPLSKYSNTASKAEPKKEEPKKVAPKVEENKIEAPKVEPMPQETPLKRVERKDCKPLRTTPNSSKYLAQGDLQSKVVRDGFTVFTLMCDQFENFFAVHRKVLVILNESAQQAAAVFDREIYDTVGVDLQVPKSERMPKKTENQKATDVDPYNEELGFWKFFENLVQLRQKCDPKDKELLKLMEEQERIRALRLHSAAKNYFYFHNRTTSLNQIILPGETPLAMRKRHLKEKQVNRKIAALAKARHLRINPVKKVVVRDYVEMKKALPHPTGPDEKMEKDTKKEKK
ncbi:unnamed protein product [Caenorhabditis auriculariae]|uniref:Uncharacterized protein n=1 Tax=Caenorhabditis auriculariae TaxID=2777116 RepID=A0A8S1HPA0_9PELO|nr:unnamed protein product [Caenorhabditis auriculariae]